MGTEVRAQPGHSTPHKKNNDAPRKLGRLLRCGLVGIQTITQRVLCATQALSAAVRLPPDYVRCHNASWLRRRGTLHALRAFFLRSTMGAQQYKHTYVSPQTQRMLVGPEDLSRCRPPFQ